MVIQDIVDGNQFAFIKGRQILNCILKANESAKIIREGNKREWQSKIDLEKAYDKTDWGFLDYVIARKGFGSKWCLWVFGCLSAAHFSIILNETPKSFCSATRGLGEAIPYHLFSLVADSLSQILKIGENNELFKGFQVGSDKVNVSHLQFADAR